jgi:hypothetical protein
MSSPRRSFWDCAGERRVFNDQILRLRPLNDNNCPTPFMLPIAITAKLDYRSSLPWGNLRECI